MGCDVFDDDDDAKIGEKEFNEWIEDEKDGNIDDDEEEEEDYVLGDNDDVVMDVNEGDDDDELGLYDEEEDLGLEEDEKYWKEEFEKVVRSNDVMENLVKRSVERFIEFYEK